MWLVIVAFVPTLSIALASLSSYRKVPRNCFAYSVVGVLVAAKTDFKSWFAAAS